MGKLLERGQQCNTTGRPKGSSGKNLATLCAVAFSAKNLPPLSNSPQCSFKLNLKHLERSRLRLCQALTTRVPNWDSTLALDVLTTGANFCLTIGTIRDSTEVWAVFPIPERGLMPIYVIKPKSALTPKRLGLTPWKFRG